LWSGGVDTDWFKAENWGGCPAPDCSRDAIINSGTVLQPAVNGAIAYCKSITINPGASLTLPVGQTLSVCGDFTNYGLLNAAPSSIVRFANTNINQNVNGNLLAPNSMGSVEVNKTGGSVTLNTGVEMTGNFTIANSSSAVQIAGAFTHRLWGNFQNNGTYSTPSGTLFFNGSVGQNYYNVYGSNQLLNNVTMLHTGPGVTLISSDLKLGTTGVLTLLSGKIITGVNEVNVQNPDPAGSVLGGGPNSFVQGFLRRHINASGNYNFPVGEAAKGFQNARANFSPLFPTSIRQLRVHFTPYAVVPGPLGVLDCNIINFNGPALNNGYWTFEPVNPTNGPGGNFQLTLQNTNYTNAAGATGWTIQSNPSSLGTVWGLATGACAASTAANVVRNNMTGLSLTPVQYGTAQGINVLPVEWLDVQARGISNIIRLDWSTATEVNALGYEVQRDASGDGLFQPIGWVNAEGNTIQISEYSFVDNDVIPGKVYYYRLRQVDFDGQQDYSKVVAGKLDANGQIQLDINPNPASAASLIRMIVPSSFTRAVLMLDNAYGSNLCTLQLNDQNAAIPLSFEEFCDQLAPGVYTVRLLVDGEQVTRKIVWLSTTDQR
jgi:hypothetical protein